MTSSFINIFLKFLTIPFASPISFFKSSISNDAILREALIRLKLNQISEAFELAEKLTHTKLAPTGLALLGEINEKYYDNMIEALDYYLKLLEKYPDSYLAEPIRLHVRSLNDQIKS